MSEHLMTRQADTLRRVAKLRKVMSNDVIEEAVEAIQVLKAVNEEQADTLRRVAKLVTYMEGGVKRAEARQSEADFTQGLDRGYASAFRLAAKWLQEALDGGL